MNSVLEDLSTIECTDLQPVQGRPLILQVDQNGAKTLDWAAENREHIITDKKGKRWKPRKPFVGADY